MSAAILENVSGRMLTVVLEHAKAKRTHKTYLKMEHNRSTGEVRRKRIRLSLPRSILLTAGEKTRELPGWVAMCPDVRRKQTLGLLKVTRAAPEPKPAPEPPKEEQAASAEAPKEVVKESQDQKPAPRRKRARRKQDSAGGKD